MCVTICTTDLRRQPLHSCGYTGMSSVVVDVPLCFMYFGLHGANAAWC